MFRTSPERPPKVQNLSGAYLASLILDEATGRHSSAYEMTSSISHIDRYTALTNGGVVGDFTHCEITEIFATVAGLSRPQNVFTLAVLQESGEVVEPRYLNDSRISVPGLKDWTFGIRQSVVARETLQNVMAELDGSGRWIVWDTPLEIAPLVQAVPQFVPPDMTTIVPLNKVLKNNFWAGSHILEWADGAKAVLQPLLSSPARLSDIAEAVLRYVPIDLAAISDRLGNIIVQIPVTALVATWGETQDGLGFQVEAIWRPGTPARPLKASVLSEYDDTVVGAATALVENGPVTLPIRTSAALPKAYLFDEAHQILVAATGALATVRQFGINMVLAGNNEPRTFGFMGRDGKILDRRIALRGASSQSLIGEARRDANGDYTRRRLFRFDTERVQRERLFQQ